MAIEFHYWKKKKNKISPVRELIIKVSIMLVYMTLSAIIKQFMIILY
jgi:hypothetical protein